MEKTVRITDYEFKDGNLHIYANDVVEENSNRIGDDSSAADNDGKVEFCFDFSNGRRKRFHWRFFYNWIHSQHKIIEAVKNPGTFGDAMKLTIGTVTSIPSKYIVPSV